MKAPQKIVNPQQWPHIFAPGEPKIYGELSLAEFCAGYLVIINQLVDKLCRTALINHFHELMILASTYQWPAVRSYHYKVLRPIELGLVQWGDSFEPFKQSFFLATCLLTEAPHKPLSPLPNRSPHHWNLRLPSHVTKFVTRGAGTTTAHHLIAPNHISASSVKARSPSAPLSKTERKFLVPPRRSDTASKVSLDLSAAEFSTSTSQIFDQPPHPPASQMTGYRHSNPVPYFPLKSSLISHLITLHAQLRKATCPNTFTFRLPVPSQLNIREF